MTVTDSQLIELGKALNQESYVAPNYLLIATQGITAVATDATSLDGETGDRVSLTGSRTGAVATFTAIRSGVDVVNTATSDSIAVSGLSSASSNVDLLTGIAHSGITQTTNFDIEFSYQFTVARRS